MTVLIGAVPYHFNDRADFLGWVASIFEELEAGQPLMITRDR